MWVEDKLAQVSQNKTPRDDSIGTQSHEACQEVGGSWVIEELFEKERTTPGPEVSSPSSNHVP